MPRLLIALVLLGCDSTNCVDAPRIELRASCERVTIPIVVHSTPEPACVGTCPSAADRVSLLVSQSSAFLEQHGVELEIVADVEDDYLPVLRDDGESCPALDSWDDETPRDGRLHVYLMHTIAEPGLRLAGYHTDGVLAISRDAVWEIFAHEVGHRLGLRHVDDPGNLMWTGDHPGAVELDATQREVMLERACAVFGSPS